MTVIKTLAITAAVACGVAGISAPLVRGVASAAPSVHADYKGNPALIKPGPLCGSGYIVYDSIRLSKPNRLGATVYLLYKGGMNCAVTIADPAITNKPFWMWVQLRQSNQHSNPGNHPWHRDANYYYNATHPVYVYGGGICVDWGGGISDYGEIHYNTHCG